MNRRPKPLLVGAALRRDSAGKLQCDRGVKPLLQFFMKLFIVALVVFPWKVEARFAGVAIDFDT